MRLHETREETDSRRMCRGDVIMMDWFLVEGIGESTESNGCAMSGVQGFDM